MPIPNHWYWPQGGQITILQISNVSIRLTTANGNKIINHNNRRINIKKLLQTAILLKSKHNDNSSPNHSFVILLVEFYKKSIITINFANHKLFINNMEFQTLTAISPIDGRYRNKVDELGMFFSEYALIKYRVRVEVE